jgi:hypothetical protein
MSYRLDDSDGSLNEWYWDHADKCGDEVWWIRIPVIDDNGEQKEIKIHLPNSTINWIAMALNELIHRPIPYLLNLGELVDIPKTDGMVARG